MGAKRAGGGGKGRLTAWCLFAVAAVVVGWGGPSLLPALRAMRYADRIRRDVNTGGNLEALGRLRHPAAVPYLERYALDPKSPLQEHASRILRREYPDSYVGRGSREYAEIVGHAYFGMYFPAHFDQGIGPRPDPARLEAWIVRFPLHPGVDDAFLCMGRALAASRPMAALAALHRGFNSPDGDKRDHLAGWFQRVLDRHASAEDLDAWAAADCPAELLDNVLYVLGVKRMREHRFGEAVSLIERALAARIGAAPAMVANFTRWKGADPWDGVEAQLATCRWMAGRAEALARASGDEERGAILHEMGRRAFREGKLFENRFYYPRLFAAERPGSDPGIDDLHPGSRYRQAAVLFRRILREFPGYGRIAEAEYSIPLCLWRIRRAWPVSARGRLDRAIFEGFQAFADRHPESTMADEALYIAAIHYKDWTGDDCVMTANAARIREEHPGGNILREHGDRPWLSEAAKPVPAAWEVEDDGNGRGAEDDAEKEGEGGEP